MVRRPPWSRLSEGAVGILLLPLLASQLWQSAFIWQPVAAPVTSLPVRSLGSGQSHAPVVVSPTPQPLRLTAFPSALALSLLACALRRSASRRAAQKTPRPRCVLKACGATLKDWQATGPLEAQRPKEPMISFEAIDVEVEMADSTATFPDESAFASRSHEGRSRTRAEARQRARQCGARLLRSTSTPPQSYPDGKAAALDMSKVRTKIQMGIRCTSTARTGSNGREAKTRPECTAPVGCCNGHKVRVECCSCTRRSHKNG